MLIHINIVYSIITIFKITHELIMMIC